MRKPSGSYKTHRTTSLQTVTNHARCNIPDNRQIVLRADPMSEPIRIHCVLTIALSQNVTEQNKIKLAVMGSTCF